MLNACSTNIKHLFDDSRKVDFRSLCGESVAGKKYDFYHLYGDSKMGLLMATFAMAQEYKNDGTCVNAIMIPATKMSKSKVKKFKLYWRFLSILQNPFIPKVEVIRNAYFSICTDKHYNGVTGKLVNHLGQIVQVADKSISFVKIMRGLEYYQPYVDDKETLKCIWAECNRFIKMRTAL